MIFSPRPAQKMEYYNSVWTLFRLPLLVWTMIFMAIPVTTLFLLLLLMVDMLPKRTPCSGGRNNCL